MRINNQPSRRTTAIRKAPLELRYILLTCMTFMLTIGEATGQLKTYMTVEAGPTWDINRVKDSEKRFSQSTSFGSISGVGLWQEVFENMFVGTGVYYHPYLSGINPIDNRTFSASWKSYPALLIPARVSYRIQLSEIPVSLTARVGYQIGFAGKNQLSYAAQSEIATPDGVILSYNYQENLSVSNIMHLLELGASFDYRFYNNWQLSVGFSHFSGFNDLFSADLVYTTSEGTNAQASYRNDGTRIQTTFNLGIPVSNLWNNQDMRIRTRIEHAAGRGSGVRKKRYIYFGGDVGPLWRSFSATNPAVGPRPMTERGLFRYTNLHTGAYVGLLFNGSTGVDVGVYYQRSSTFFSLMYDHETDFVTRQSAPMFIEVPLMFKYFYDLYDEKVFLVPTLGVGVLTHFSGEAFGSGSGSFNYSGNDQTLNFTASRTARIGVMVKAGAGCEYRLPIRFPLLATAYLHYNHGLLGIDEIAVTTSLTESPDAATIRYTGSGWNFSVGLRLPLLLGKENRRCGAIPMR